MVRLTRWSAAALVVFASILSPSGAQQLQQFSGAQREAAMNLEAAAIAQMKGGGGGVAPMAAFSADAIPGLRSTPTGREGKSVVTGVVPVPPRGTSRIVTQVLVTRYDYGTGLTVRTLVDLSANQALEIKADRNFPTPLADEETKRALDIAAEVVPELAELGPGKPESAPNLLTIIDTLPTSPTYGHRLVVVWRRHDAASQRVLVDLTTESVADPMY